jgi:hypothetical protein
MDFEAGTDIKFFYFTKMRRAKRRDIFEFKMGISDLDVGGRIILKCILEKWEGWLD